MAIQWGAWVGAAPRRMRLGVDFVSVPTPGGNDQAVTVRAKVYVGAQWGFADSNNQFSYSGHLGASAGSRQINVSTNGTREIQALSRSITVSTSPTPLTVQASLSGIEYIGSSLTASVTATATIPAKPTTIPGPPSNVRMGRNSDLRHTIWWDAAAGQVTRYKVELWASSTNSWALLGYTTSLSFQVTTTTPNDAYRPRVTAEGPGGSSTDVWGPAIVRTTPAPVGAVVASRVAGGIRLDWSGLPPQADRFWIYASDGGGYSLLQNVPRTNNFVHASPDVTKIWSYRVYSVVTAAHSGIDTQLVSDFAQSNALDFVAPPNAPELLAPTGFVPDPWDPPVTFTWTHRPVDGSAQSAYELRYRLTGVGSWVTRSGGAAQTHTETLSEMGAYEWQVRTRGQHANFGPWSATGTFEAVARPTVAITYPADGGTVPGARVIVEFTGTYSQGRYWVHTVAQLLNASGEPLETGILQGTERTWAVPLRLDNDTTYRVSLESVDSLDMRSVPAEHTFATSFALPAVPTLTADWDAETASVSLVPTAGSGGEPTVFLDVERSTDEGLTWQRIADTVSSGEAATDTMPPLRGPLWYRPIAFTALRAVAYGEPIEVTPPPATRAYFTAQDGSVISVPYNLAIPGTTAPLASTHRVLGRRKRLAIFDLDTDPSYSVQLTGVVLPRYDGEQYGEHSMTSLLLSQTLYYRDPAGRAFWAVVTSDFAYDPTPWGHEGVSLTVEEVAEP